MCMYVCALMRVYTYVCVCVCVDVRALYVHVCVHVCVFVVLLPKCYLITCQAFLFGNTLPNRGHTIASV